MACLTAILTSIVISVMETIGIITCCRFSDQIETSLSIPESLIENITKLSETVKQIKEKSHSVRIDQSVWHDWVLKAEVIVEEARPLLLPESGLSTNNDDRQSCCCFGFYERLPCKLQWKVKKLIEEGQRIISTATEEPIRPPIGEGSTIEQAVAHGVPDTEEGTTVEEPSRLTVEEIRPHIEEGSTINETLDQAVAHGVLDIEAGSSERKPLELEHTGGVPGILSMEEGTTSLQQTVEHTCDVSNIETGTTVEEPLRLTVEEIRPHTEKGSTTDATLEQPITSISGVPDIEEVTAVGKVSDWEHPDEIETLFEVDIKDYRTMRETLSQVKDMLGDNGIRKIGIWGPGGVGKTALVRALTNELKNTSSSSLSFSLVISISVTGEVDLNNMQKVITDGLKLMIEKKTDTKKVANQICRRLQREKFLLILDNVWESIDLSGIGIPENQMGSKIVLTIRRLEVCKTMQAEVVKMDYPSAKEAWRLLSRQVGDAMHAQGIRDLAETVRKECGRLPMALVSVGSSMRGETDSEQWHNAIEKLRNSIPLNDIVLQVYKSLKLSYDSLKNDNLKSCFLYCSLYPPGSEIAITELVGCWLAENLIDNNLDYVDAFSEGLESIQQLMNCSLLDKSGEHVRMDVMVHHVARWIAKSECKAFVFSGDGISKSPFTLPKELNNHKWISFTGSDKFTRLDAYLKNFPNATTVLINDGHFVDEAVLEKLLEGSGALKVLNIKHLRNFSVSCLPSVEIRALLLRNCVDGIEELPYVRNLMVIDFPQCGVRKLPRVIKRFTDLKVLNLSNNLSNEYGLRSIDADILRALERLEVLDTWKSGYKWSTRKRDDESENATLQDLSKLTCLKAVYVELADIEGNYEEFKWMEKLKGFSFAYGSDRWSTISCKQTREKIFSIFLDLSGTAIGSFILHAEKLRLANCKPNETLLQFSTFEKYSSSKLKSLVLIECTFSDESTETAPNYSILSNLEELQLFRNEARSFSQMANAVGRTFPELKSLDIGYGYELKELFSFKDLHMKLPKLEKITVRHCTVVKEIFRRDPRETQAAFPNLKKLVLESNSFLQSLSNSEWNDQWTSLETLIVIQCPILKRLPRMNSIKEIRGSVVWWNDLEWDSEQTRSFMNQRFKPRRDPYLPRFDSPW